MQQGSTQSAPAEGNGSSVMVPHCHELNSAPFPLLFSDIVTRSVEVQQVRRSERAAADLHAMPIVCFAL
jgi:hypothetical protein